MILTALAGCLANTAAAEELDAPPPAWRVADIDIEGVCGLSAGELESQMRTEQRAWWAPWRERPGFDPLVFDGDLENLRRACEARGYYQARVEHEIEEDADAGEVRLRLRIEEGPLVRVRSIDIEASGDAAEVLPVSDELRQRLPLQPGDAFVEEEYQRGEVLLRTLLFEEGHPRAVTQRRAEVDLDFDSADIWYSAVAGPLAEFGETTVVGTEDVDPHLVERELVYEPGERFSVSALERSRQRILALDLFRSVRLTIEEESDEPTVVAIRATVEEKPPRLVRIGGGYSTDEGPRGMIEWRHRNWLGGGRQLSLQLRGSRIRSEAAALFVQPHFLGRDNRGSLAFRLFRDIEQTYDLTAVRLVPRFERRFGDSFVAYIGYRVELDKLTDIDPTAVSALGGVKNEGLLSAPGLGFVWNTADDPLNPKSGEEIKFDVEQAGKIWGGEFSYWRATAEAKKYVSIGWETVLAGRLKLGLSDSIGPLENLPLFERFYAGGERSVRGYFRRRLGPMTANNNPLGGRSLFEGSIELRRPIWGPLGGAVFLDFGQVSVEAFDPPIDDLRFAPGVGATYDTPIGPLRLDVGFALDPPRGDQPFQVHFSIGQFF